MNIPQYDLDGLGGEYLVTQQLERSIAEYLGVKHCILASSGTAAIFMALRAVGAKVVAIPPLTMIGSATAAELAGCKIEFVSGSDIPATVDTYLHVSLNGRPCNIDEVMAKHPNLTVVEDACQSFGAQHRGRFFGTFGAVGCFSFSPHKIISAGNGGCVVTNDDDIAVAVRRLKNFGRESGGADHFEHLGYNFKFTDIQAQFMLPQFKVLPERLEAKRRLYARYYAALEAYMRPHEGTPWFVDAYFSNRDAVAAALKAQGVGTRAMYPLVPTQKPFAGHTIHGDSSEDARYSANGLWLPSSLSLTDEQIDYVIGAVQSATK